MSDSIDQGALAPHSEPKLINVFLGQIGGVPAHVCDGRELHTYLKNGDKFADWAKMRIEKYGFVENQDFVLVSAKTEIKGRGGDRRSKDYHFSLDMAKELSMVENNDEGRKARRYFIAKEKEALAAAGQIVPASHTETLLPSEQQTLKEIVNRKVSALVAEGDKSKAFGEIWSRLQNKFRVAKYSQLPRTQFADAIVYITSMDVRAVPPAPTLEEEPRLSPQQRIELNQAVTRALAGCFDLTDGGVPWAHNRLRVLLNLRSIEDMRPDQLPRALDELKSINENLNGVFAFRAEWRKYVEQEIIGAGTPWTPAIVRNWRAKMKQLVPARPEWLKLALEIKLKLAA